MKEKILLEKLTKRKLLLKENNSDYNFQIIIDKGDGQLSMEDIKLFIEFLSYCYKNLEIHESPEIQLVLSRNKGMTSGGYLPEDNLVITYIKHRHIIDICRSVAHELKHADQCQNDRLEIDEEDSARCPSEVEATVFGAKMMREFSKLHPEIYRE